MLLIVLEMRQKYSVFSSDYVVMSQNILLGGDNQIQPEIFKKCALWSKNLSENEGHWCRQERRYVMIYDLF